MTTRNLYDDIPLLIQRLDEARLRIGERAGDTGFPYDDIDELIGAVAARLSTEARRERARRERLAGLVVAL